MPALPVAIGLASGVAASVFCEQAWMAALPLALGIALWLTNRGLAGITAIMMGVGLFTTIMRTPQTIPAEIADRQCTLIAKIIKATPRNSHTRYIVEAQDISFKDSIHQPIGLRFVTREYTDRAEIDPGSVVRLVGEIKPFGTEVGVPGHFDMTMQHNIDGTSGEFIIAQRNIQIISPPTSWLDRLENNGSRAIKHAIVSSRFDEPTTVFLLATISGDDILMDSATKEAYRSTGTAHLLALSGLHTGIVFAIASVLLWLLRFLPYGFSIYYTAISLVVLAYAVATGLSPSVARAAIMVCVFAVSRIVERDPQTANSLCLTIIAWLLYNPFWLFSPGFQLSVAAVAAIIWVNKLCQRIDSRQRILRKCVATIAIPIAAMAATIAISMAYFHAFPTYFLVSNLLTGLLAGPLIAGGMICALLTGLGLKLSVLPAIISFGHRILDSITTTIATWPHAYIEGIYPAPEQLIAYLALLVCIVVAVHARRRVAAYAAAALGGALCMSFTIAPKPQGAEAWVLDNHAAPVVLLRNDDAVYTVTNLDESRHASVAENLRQYAQKCGADSVVRAHKGLSTGPFAVHGDVITAGKFTVLTINSRQFAKVQHADYALIGRGWRGDIAHLARTVPADTFVIMPDMNARRRTRYERTLRALSKPTKSAPFRIM